MYRNKDQQPAPCVSISPTTGEVLGVVQGKKFDWKRATGWEPESQDVTPRYRVMAQQETGEEVLVGYAAWKQVAEQAADMEECTDRNALRMGTAARWVPGNAEVERAEK